MTDADDLHARIDALRAQLHDVYRINGRDLGQALRRARRVLPRRLRKAGQSLVEAEGKLGNPRLEPMVNFAELRGAHDRITEHLDAVDVGEMRKRRMLVLFGMLAANVIFVASCFVVWMVWAGYL